MSKIRLVTEIAMVFGELFVVLIADIGRFQETMLNEGRGQDNNGARRSAPKGGAEYRSTEVSATGRHYQAHCRDLHWE